MDSRESTDYKSRFDLVYSGSNMAFGEQPERELQKFIESNGHSGHALDMGCGDGRHALFLARRGYNVTGLDISAVGVKKLQERAKGLNLDSVIYLNQIDARKFDYQPDSFNLVVAVTLFDHLPKEDVLPLLDKVSLSLKPGGVLFTKVHTTNDPGRTAGKEKASQLSWAIRHYFEPGELKSMLEIDFVLNKYIEYDDLDQSHGLPHYHNFAVALARKIG